MSLTGYSTLDALSPGVPLYEGWMERAKCIEVEDPDLMFPSKSQVDQANEMKARFCHQCDVIEECLNHALTINEKRGIRGGYTEEERQEKFGKFVSQAQYGKRVNRVSNT